MKPSEVRREILEQHATLRKKMLEARAAAERVAKGAPPAQLREAIAAVAESLRAHSLREEEVMEDLFPPLDGWGHKPVLFDDHVTEHRQLYEELLDASTKTDVRAADALLDRIFEHMDREERVLLADDVLSGEYPAVHPPA